VDDGFAVFKLDNLAVKGASNPDPRHYTFLSGLECLCMPHALPLLFSIDIASIVAAHHAQRPARDFPRWLRGLILSSSPRPPLQHSYVIYLYHAMLVRLPILGRKKK
jgi:hypothetical protein